jgi:cation diffusion facilitator family transporter
MSGAPPSPATGNVSGEATSAAAAGGRTTVIKEGAPKGATRTVVIAVLANLGVALAKAVATLMTGSAAMLAETVHSLADTANEILLYVGLRRSRPEPDASHPFGYGQERWFWSFLAALGIFLVGGLLAIAEGIRSLLKPEPLESFLVGLGVLLVSFVLEAISWRNAYKEVRAEAERSSRSLSDHLSVSSDPTAQTVFYEDTAALIGLVLAIAALVLHEVTGSAVYDSVASILIGVLLSVVAFLLTRHNRRLLIDSSAPPDLVQRMHDELAGRPGVAEVSTLQAVWIGPRQLLLCADLVFAPGEDVVSRIAAMREELLEMSVIAAVKLTPVAA